ncbi:MAG: hypothetical protein BroJett040_18130 [Oligoflexia bacterium]|nr:MAG: hypothetical protein BroJett040_18130 [Oligoflexia bacterium]
MTKHLQYALLIGFILRLFSSYFVYGPQALDDYLNQILPALRMDQGLPHDLPVYRSALMIWILLGWTKLGHLLAIETVLSQIRWIYFFLGTTSLIGILGVHYYFSDKKDSLAYKLSLYLMAAYGLMPFISTRGFLESFATCFVTFGLGLLVHAIREKKDILICAGLYLIGFATLLRFQVGLIYVFAVAYFIYQKNWKLFFQSIGVGIALILTQIGIEVLDGRAPMSVLLNYFKANENVAQYGAQPWYTTWATWLFFLYFPFSIGIAKGAKQLKDHSLLIGSTLFFVFVHSLVPHKEERFLYPIVGLTIIILAIAWANQWGQRWEKIIFRPGFYFLNSILLVVGCFVNTQVGEIGFPAEIQQQSNKVLYFDRDSLVGLGYMHEIFIRPPSKLIKLTDKISNEALAPYRHELQNMDGFVLLTSNPDYRGELQVFSGKMALWFQCSVESEKNSLTDALIYKMNPKRNYRRRPTWAVVCLK